MKGGNKGRILRFYIEREFESIKLGRVSRDTGNGWPTCSEVEIGRKQEVEGDSLRDLSPQANPE